MEIKKPSSHREYGFTLVEMMVALLIFAMLSVSGVLLLRSAVDSDEVTGERLGEMAAMQRFVSLLEADLSQAVARTYRDAQGTRQPAFEGGDRDHVLAFISGGKNNLNNAPRSNLQRVQYRWKDRQISRLHHEMTDGGAISEPALLLEDIVKLEVRYRNKKGLWSDAWRTERLDDLPRAVELKFEHRGRDYRHLFVVGTGYL